MNSGNEDLSARLRVAGKTQRKALRHIIHVMASHGWNQTLTARTLGVTHRTLSRWLRRYPLLAQAYQERRPLEALQTMRSLDTHVIVAHLSDDAGLD